MYLSLRDRPAPGSAPRAGRRVATTVVLLGIVSMLTDISSEMITAVLPVYLTTELGLGLLAYGVIDGVYQGVSASVRILGGFGADRTRRPKWIAAVGYGASALSRIGLSLVHGLGPITAVITVDRLGKGLRTAPRDALIADASTVESLGYSFGVHRALDTLGAAIGPLVAFAVLLAVPEGYDSVFVVSFAVAVVGVAVLVLLVPDRRTAGSEARRMTLRVLGSTLVARHLRRPLLAAGVLGLVTVGDGFLYLILQQRNDLAALWFPLLYVGTNVAFLMLAVPFGRLADRWGRARMFLGGHGCLLVAYAVLAGPVHGAFLVIVVLGLLGAFYAATDGVLAALVSQAAPAESRGTEIAAAQTVVAVARFTAAVGFGGLLVSRGPTPSLVIVGVLLGVAMVAGTVLIGRSA